MKRILIVARCQREAEDYRRTLTREQYEVSRYASYPEHFGGTHPDHYEVHLIGHYYENPRWEYIRADLNIRKLPRIEVAEWR